MIKALVFDIGRVMASENNMKDHYVPLRKALNIDEKEFFKARKKYISKAASGKITGNKMISLFAKDLKINYNVLLKNWIKFKIKSQKKNFELEKIIKKLKKQKYKVGSLSGVIDLHYKIGMKNKIYNVFDFNLTSFKMGLVKPHPKMYRLLIKKLKLKPEEIVIIDDTKSCLDVAKKQELKVILFKNNKQFLKSLKKLGIEL